MPAPTTTPVTTPTVTPATQPVPWTTTHTDPARICPQQRREGASPDVAPRSTIGGYEDMYFLLNGETGE